MKASGCGSFDYQCLKMTSHVGNMTSPMGQVMGMFAWHAPTRLCTPENNQHLKVLIWGGGGGSNN